MRNFPLLTYTEPLRPLLVFDIQQNERFGTEPSVLLPTLLRTPLGPRLELKNKAMILSAIIMTRRQYLSNNNIQNPIVKCAKENTLFKPTFKLGALGGEIVN